MRAWIAAAAVGVASCASTGPSGMTHPMQIEDVSVSVAKSLPPQVTAHVRGIIPDGCSALGDIRQERDGSTVRLTITVRRISDGPCIQRVEFFERDLRLEGPFPAGHYVLRVNDLVREFDI